MSKKYIALDNVLELIDVKMCGDPIKHKVIEAVLNLPARSRYEAITSKSIHDLAIFFTDYSLVKCRCCSYYNYGNHICGHKEAPKREICAEGVEQWLKGEAEDDL